jgi:hypothetical protein
MAGIARGRLQQERKNWRVDHVSLTYAFSKAQCVSTQSSAFAYNLGEGEFERCPGETLTSSQLAFFEPSSDFLSLLLLRIRAL